MKFQKFLIKYGEIGIKGNNRHVFEDALVKRIRHALKRLGEFEITKERGRIYVNGLSDFDYDACLDTLSKIFGIVGICPMMTCGEKDKDSIFALCGRHVEEVYGEESFTFKVESRRIDKNFPGTSMELSADIGEYLLEKYPQLTVDVHEPDVLLNVEIRDAVYVYSKTIPGAGGMPVGTSGKAMLLLSGGIDSPVAGYMMAKRGVVIDAVYFHAPPYTSDRAKEKVVELARIISAYTGPIRLHIVNFTDIQLHIYDKCPHEELTIIMRRYMMRIAERLAEAANATGLVTGESVGQVASQTMASLYCTNMVCTMPVYRPLVAFDKNDIIREAEKIGTFETSTLPYEDCCTIFVAKHPVTKPVPKRIEKSETFLDRIDELVEKAIAETEIVTCRI
ncbi:MAG: tRNA 4-thiouridine(8) synthase ThiI [Lachnospiraceae bacterium]|nr:tRNA 4-thiouridine(8) synthase ThiI [Lachnospiraceae bacterium]